MEFFVCFLWQSVKAGEVQSADQGYYTQSFSDWSVYRFPFQSGTATLGFTN